MDTKLDKSCESLPVLLLLVKRYVSMLSKLRRRLDFSIFVEKTISSKFVRYLTLKSFERAVWLLVWL